MKKQKHYKYIYKRKEFKLKNKQFIIYKIVSFQKCKVLETLRTLIVVKYQQKLNRKSRLNAN